MPDSHFRREDFSGLVHATHSRSREASNPDFMSTITMKFIFFYAAMLIILWNKAATN